jgi:hypothetical protein
MALDQLGQRDEAGVQELAQLLGAAGALAGEPLRQRGEAGEVGEQDGGGEALLGRLSG